VAARQSRAWISLPPESPYTARVIDTMTDRFRAMLSLPVLLGAGVLLAACATEVPLAPTDRVALKVIHVVHYESPLPVMKSLGKVVLPAPESVRKTTGADPAALVATSFGRLLEKTEKLNNLRVEPKQLARPVARHPQDLHTHLGNGLALELWVNQWGFEAIPGVPGQFSLRLDGNARLSNPLDGRVLWSSAACRVNGMGNRSFRSTAGDLSSTVKLRKLLAAARNECARQLARDFDRTARRRSS
jgi:hypothetical protein